MIAEAPCVTVICMVEVGPGERAYVPAHASHLFANKSGGPIRFRRALEPASRGFEELQQIGVGLLGRRAQRRGVDAELRRRYVTW